MSGSEYRYMCSIPPCSYSQCLLNKYSYSLAVVNLVICGVLVIKDFAWFWSTSYMLLEEYIEQGYEDEDLAYAYDTERVLIELYSTIQVMS